MFAKREAERAVLERRYVSNERVEKVVYRRAADGDRTAVHGATVDYSVMNVKTRPGRGAADVDGERSRGNRSRSGR